MKIASRFLMLIFLFLAISCEKSPNPEDIVTGRFVYLKDGKECNANIGIFIDNPYVYFEKSEIPRRLRNDKDTIYVEIIYHQIIGVGNPALCPIYKIDYIKEID